MPDKFYGLYAKSFDYSEKMIIFKDFIMTVERIS